MDEKRLAEIQKRLDDGCSGHEVNGALEYCCCFEDEALELLAEVQRLRPLVRDYIGLIESDYPLHGHYGEQHRLAKIALGDTPDV